MDNLLLLVVPPSGDERLLVLVVYVAGLKAPANRCQRCI
jgi:hypothetical protein